MNLKSIAIKSGCTIVRCNSEWGGTWGFKDAESPNATWCGYRTEKRAYEAFLEDKYGMVGLQVMKNLMNENKRLKELVKVLKGIK